MASAPEHNVPTAGHAPDESRRTEGGSVFVLLLLGMSVLAATVRLWGIADRELWFDENCTFYIVHHLFDWPADGPDPLSEVAHLPYFFLLNLWTGIVGETIWGMRSFSALIGALTVSHYPDGNFRGLWFQGSLGVYNFKVETNAAEDTQGSYSIGATGGYRFSLADSTINIDVVVLDQSSLQPMALIDIGINF